MVSRFADTPMGRPWFTFRYDAKRGVMVPTRWQMWRMPIVVTREEFERGKRDTRFRDALRRGYGSR